MVIYLAGLQAIPGDLYEAAVLGIKTAAEIMQAAEAKANEILAKQQ